MRSLKMVPTRIVTLAGLTCAIPVLISCAHQTESVDRQIEQQLAEHHVSCLSAARPAYSPEHTDCVLARHQERQRELERLRNAVAPAPKAATEAPPAAPGWNPQPDWMI
jgi:hypothetical protein